MKKSSEMEEVGHLYHLFSGNCLIRTFVRPITQERACGKGYLEIFMKRQIEDEKTYGCLKEFIGIRYFFYSVNCIVYAVEFFLIVLMLLRHARFPAFLPEGRVSVLP